MEINHSLYGHLRLNLKFNPDTAMAIASNPANANWKASNNAQFKAKTCQNCKAPMAYGKYVRNGQGKRVHVCQRCVTELKA